MCFLSKNSRVGNKLRNYNYGFNKLSTILMLKFVSHVRKMYTVSKQN